MWCHIHPNATRLIVYLSGFFYTFSADKSLTKALRDSFPQLVSRHDVKLHPENGIHLLHYPSEIVAPT